MASPANQSEEGRRLEVRRQTWDELPSETRLLTDLVLGAYRQLERIQSVDGDARRFQLLLLVQSVNAAFCALGLLTDGYPRQALHFARFLREGHVSFRWSSSPESTEDLARHLADWRSGAKWPRGTWPRVGDMAKTLPEKFLKSAPYRDYQAWMLDVSNELFSHAVSDWALGTAFGRSEPDEWRPAVGPTFDLGGARAAAGVSLSLFTWLLVDAGEFAAAATGKADRDAVDPLLSRALAALDAQKELGQG